MNPDESSDDILFPDRGIDAPTDKDLLSQTSPPSEPDTDKLLEALDNLPHEEVIAWWPPTSHSPGLLLLNVARSEAEGCDRVLHEYGVANRTRYMHWPTSRDQVESARRPVMGALTAHPKWHPMTSRVIVLPGHTPMLELDDGPDEREIAADLGTAVMTVMGYVALPLWTKP